MGMFSKLNLVVALGALISLAGCGILKPSDSIAPASDTPESSNLSVSPNTGNVRAGETTIWDIFKPKSSNTSTSVNKYIWKATLEVLNFLPVQSVDPFTGVIVTGYGTPPGGNRAYRATALVNDPALEARSLNVALQTRDGRAVSKATVRAVEDAILSRARELRISDNKF